MIPIGTKVVCSYDGGIYEVVGALRRKGKDFPDGHVYLIRNEEGEFWTSSSMLSTDLTNRKVRYEQLALF